MRNILVPVFGGVIVLMIIGAGSQFFVFRNKRLQRVTPGTARNYGIKGGTICKRCGRPYSIHFWSINLAVGALDRCEHCGHWAVVRSRPQAELRAAEQAELQDQSIPVAQPLSPEEELRRQLDESRYINGK